MSNTAMNQSIIAEQCSEAWALVVVENTLRNNSQSNNSIMDPEFYPRHVLLSTACVLDQGGIEQSEMAIMDYVTLLMNPRFSGYVQQPWCQQTADTSNPSSYPDPVVPGPSRAAQSWPIPPDHGMPSANGYYGHAADGRSGVKYSSPPPAQYGPPSRSSTYIDPGVLRLNGGRTFSRSNTMSSEATDTSSSMVGSETTYTPMTTPSSTPASQGPVPNRIYHCSNCGDPFTTRSNCVRHEQSVCTRERTFPCPVCPKELTRRYNLKAHLKGEHQLELD